MRSLSQEPAIRTLPHRVVFPSPGAFPVPALPLPLYFWPCLWAVSSP